MALWLKMLVVLFGLGAGAPARAEIRALLVGVSTYDESIGLTSLRGPANDVRLYRDVLAARGVTDMRILADGVEGGGVPTRAAILGALADLARDARAGDLVFISLSGHGTRQPDQNGDETDGLDEVFLPADTARAEPGAQSIPNAIIDDELGEAVTAIRMTGADVWFVLDSCHSGSGLRAAAPDVALRYVDPGVLGVTAAEIVPASVEPLLDTGSAEPPGQLIALYAARASEVAREVNLTPEAADDAGWYGLFSSRLAARMADGGALTYRQLFQAVLADMNDGAVPGGARMQTPSWEGNMIDATVFGGGATAGLRQFAVTRDEMAAGRVQGMTRGTLVALVADAAAPPEATIGHAQLEDVEPTLAYLRPVDASCVPMAEALCPATGALPSDARFARVLARPVDTALRISPPMDLVTGAPLVGGPLAEGLAAAMASVNDGSAARVEIDPAGYGIEVVARDGRLWFGRRAEVAGQPVGLSWGPGDGTPLAPLIIRMARAEELAAVLSSVAASGSMLNPPPVDVAADLRAVRIADLDPPGAGGNPVRECRRAQGAVQDQAPGPLGDAPDLKQCDLVTFRAQGAVPGARDVNRIHIDARFCVHAAHEHVEDTRAAAALGAPMVMCSDCPDGFAAGDERLFILITESRDNAEALNLEGLVETCGEDGGAPTRGPAASQAAAFLERLGRRPDTRGAFGGLNIADVWVTEYRWRVLPRETVFAGVQSKAAP